MNPSNPRVSPFDQILVETQTGCLVNVARSALAAAPPLCAADEPPSRSPSSTPADVLEGNSNDSVRSSLLPAASADGGGASSALPVRRRRTQSDPTEQPSPAATDMIGRFQMIINIVESTGNSARPQPEVGELLKAVQCLQLATGELHHRQQKRRRRPAGSPEIPAAASGGRSSVSLLQETIDAIEQMRLSEPMEHSEEYAEVLSKLKELLRTEEEDDG